MRPSYIGVDYKTTEISVALIAGDDLIHCDTRFASSLEALAHYTWKLKVCQELVAELAERMAEANVGGHLCVIEQPGGRTVPRKLLMHEGIQLAVFGSVFASVDVAIPTWRKHVLGKGNATKEDAVAYVKGRYGLTLTHDEAEAICLAVYGMECSGDSA